MDKKRRRIAYGALLLALAGGAGCALSIFNFYASVAIGHTDGVLVVILTTALMWIAALVIAFAQRAWTWLRALLLVLLVIDVIGTGLAGYFLEAQVLMAFMGVAFIGWLLHVILGPGRERRARPEPRLDHVTVVT